MTDTERLVYNSLSNSNMDQRIGSQEDLLFGTGQLASWRDWRNWSRKQKMFVVCICITGICLLLSMIVFATVYSSKAAVIVPTTTLAPITTTTPASTTTPPTTTSTTPSTTTSTTPSTTTSTTPSTTTSTTPPTTTSTTPPTTTSTTPPTTTSTTPPTTEKTTEHTTTPSSTTTASTTIPPYHPPTDKPLPPNPNNMSAVTLLDYMKANLHQNYTEIQCKLSNPQTFRIQLVINEEHVFIGDSTTKRHAKEASARAATEEMFELNYTNIHPIIPTPAHPCIPVSLPTDEEL